jgi:hypothetical protein
MAAGRHNSHHLERVGARVLLAAILSVLCAVVGPLSAYADGFDTSTLALSPTAYFPLTSGTTSFPDLTGHPPCTMSSGWPTAATHNSTGPGSATGSTNFNGNSMCAYANALVFTTASSYNFWYLGGPGFGNMTVEAQLNNYGSCPCEQVSVDVANELCMRGTGGNVCTPPFGSSAGFADSTTWHMWTITNSASETCFYGDAALIGACVAGSYHAAFTSNFSTIARAESWTGTPLYGNIARLGIWGAHTLTPTEITNLFTASAGLPPAHLQITPGYAVFGTDRPVTFTVASISSTGTDTTSGDSFTVHSAGASGITCRGLAISTPVALIGSTINCQGTTPGTYILDWTNSTSLVSHTLFKLVSPTARFELYGHGVPGSPQPVVGQLYTVSGQAVDANFVDISGTDPWTFDATPAHLSCTGPNSILAPGFATIAAYEGVCVADAPGTYTIAAHDQQGFPATLIITWVGAPVASIVCGSTDIGCYLTQIWNSLGALANIPGDIVRGVYALFFVSTSGVSFINLDPLSNAAWPQITCRSGQTPTAPDAIHCYAFPFSVPSDVGAMLDLVNATPSAPVLALVWDFPLWTGTVLHETASIDPRVVLTDQTMTYVRDAELFLFIIGCAMGTWRILQLVGVN